MVDRLILDEVESLVKTNKDLNANLEEMMEINKKLMATNMELLETIHQNNLLLRQIISERM